MNLPMPIPLAIVPERLSDVAFWPEGSTLPLGPILWVIALAGVGFGFWHVRRHWPEWSRHLEPLRCYCRLARKVGLAWRDIVMLWWMARRCGLSSPLTLMVCDATLTAHADHLVERLSPGHARRFMRQVESIRLRLFESPA